jgi:hypothetical protein
MAWRGTACSAAGAVPFYMVSGFERNGPASRPKGKRRGLVPGRLSDRVALLRLSAHLEAVGACQFVAPWLDLLSEQRSCKRTATNSPRQISFARAAQLWEDQNWPHRGFPQALRGTGFPSWRRGAGGAVSREHRRRGCHGSRHPRDARRGQGDSPGAGGGIRSNRRSRSA